MQPPPQAVPPVAAGPPPAGSPRGVLWAHSPYRRRAGSSATAPATCPPQPVTDPFVFSRQALQSGPPGVQGPVPSGLAQYPGVPVPHTDARDSSQAPWEPPPGPPAQPRADASLFPSVPASASVSPRRRTGVQSLVPARSLASRFCRIRLTAFQEWVLTSLTGPLCMGTCHGLTGPPVGTTRTPVWGQPRPPPPSPSLASRHQSSGRWCRGARGPPASVTRPARKGCFRTPASSRSPRCPASLEVPAPSSTAQHPQPATGGTSRPARRAETTQHRASVLKACSGRIAEVQTLGRTRSSGRVQEWPAPPS